MTEFDPVQPGESILRLIHPRYYVGTSKWPIDVQAFRPTDRDSDGLSVFRERFCTPAQALGVVVDPERQATYRVARIPLDDLTKLGLSVRPMPIAVTPGHAVIPELSVGAYRADKARLKEIQVALAKIASRSIIPVSAGEGDDRSSEES